MTITLRSWYPHRVSLDPDDEGSVQAVDLRITRFTVEQGKAFNQQWARVMSPPSARAIFRRMEGDEQEKRTVGTRDVFFVDDAEVRRRRLEEMTPEARDAFDRQEADDAAYEYDFFASTVRLYVRVAPGQTVLFEPEEESESIPLRTGAELVQAFGGNRVLMMRLARAVWMENTLTGEVKNAWRSRFASSTSSRTPATGVAGGRPDETAGPAEPAVSAATEGVTASSAPSLSGAIVM